MPGKRPIVTSAKLIACCTLASRITGLVRDMLLLQTYSLAWIADAWNYAFQFPNLFRRLLGEGALAAAFVPAFTRVLEAEGRAAAWRLLARTLGLLAAALTTLIVVLELVVAAVWLLLAPDDPAQAAARELLLALTALMLPFMFTICTVALLASVLNCVGSFVPGALTPIVLNLFMIAGIVWLGPALGPQPRVQIFGVAIAVLVAGVVQILILLPVLRAHDVRLGIDWNLRDPNLRTLLRQLGPVLIGQGLLVLSPFLDTQICVFLTRLHNQPAERTILGLPVPYALEEGALTALTNATRLYQFPLGVVAVSLGVAALPALTRLVTRDDWPAWRRELLRATRLSTFVGMLAGAMMIAAAEPIVRMLFEYRRFGPEHTLRVAHVVRCYGLGMWAFCAHHLVLRGFYSLGDVRTPLKISCALMPVNLAISLVLVWFDPIREAAFAISASLTATASVLIGLMLLTRRSGTRLVDLELLSALVRMLVAAALAALAARLVLPSLEGLPIGSRIAGRIITAFAALGCGSAAYLLAAWLLRLPEPALLLRLRSGPDEHGSA